MRNHVTKIHIHIKKYWVTYVFIGIIIAAKDIFKMYDGGIWELFFAYWLGWVAHKYKTNKEYVSMIGLMVLFVTFILELVL